jgi:hypothetical protein
MFHTHLHPHVALTRKTNGRNLEIVQKAMLSGNREELYRQEERVGTYIWIVVADLPIYTASHPECREFHALRSENHTPHKRSINGHGTSSEVLQIFRTAVNVLRKDESLRLVCGLKTYNRKIPVCLSVFGVYEIRDDC